MTSSNTDPPVPPRDITADIAAFDTFIKQADDHHHIPPHKEPSRANNQPETDITIPIVEPRLYIELTQMLYLMATRYKTLEGITLPGLDAIPGPLGHDAVPGFDPLNTDSLGDKTVLRDAAHLRQAVENLTREAAVKSVNKGLSRVEVAKLLGVHQVTIAKWVKQANGAKQG